MVLEYLNYKNQSMIIQQKVIENKSSIQQGDCNYIISSKSRCEFGPLKPWFIDEEQIYSKIIIV